jgi:NDP-sugar pyrophosphorylase family protein
MEQPIVVALMLAGMSSRFGGSPKALAVVAGEKTLLEVSMAQAMACEPSRFVLIVRRETEALFRRAVRDDFPRPVAFVFQEFDPSRRKKPFGTTEALCAALSLAGETERVVVINGDDLYGESAFRQLRVSWSGDGIIGLCPMFAVVPAEGRVNRGMVAVDGDRVVAVEEWVGIDSSTPGIDTALASVNLIGIGPRLARGIEKDLAAARAEYYNDSERECMLTESIDRALRADRSLRIVWFGLKDRVVGITHPGDEDKIRRSLDPRAAE